MYVNVFVAQCTNSVQYPQRPEKRARSMELALTDSCGAVVENQGSLGELLSAVKPSLRPH